MKKVISLITAMMLLIGIVAMYPVSAQETIDDYLITHWDFAGNNPYADKAANGSVSDQLKEPGTTARRSVKDGVVKIENGSNYSYLYCEDSADLMRTEESRTIFVKFKTDTVDQALALINQNGVLHMFHNANDGSINATTGTKGTWTPYNPIFASATISADTWYTVALTQSKSGDNVTIKMYLLAGGNWVSSGTATTTLGSSAYYPTDTCSTNSTYGEDSMYIGRKNDGTWNSIASLEIDDIRIYNKALTLAEVQTIEVTNPTSEVASAGHSLTLTGDVGVNFLLSPRAYLANNDSATVTISNGDNVLTTAKFDSNHVSENGAYKFTANVAAKQMSDTLTLKVSYGDKVLYTENYSVKEYANYIINNSSEYDAKTLALVKAMLNYGGYAQTYFDYNTADLANNGLDLALSTLTKDTESYKVAVEGAVDGLTPHSASLILETKTSVVFRFSLADGASYSDYTFEGGTAQMSEDGDSVIIVTDGIFAQNINAMQTLTVTKGSETLTVKYSPMTYIMSKVDNNGSALDNLVRALNDYYVAALAYVD